MALIKCPECDKNISDKAESCPHCGYSFEKKANNNTLETLKGKWNNKYLLVLLVLLVGGYFIFFNNSFYFFYSKFPNRKKPNISLI